MKNKILPVKGSRDFYPKIKSQQNWLFSKAREVSKRFGYQEYEGPLLEPVELYQAKSSTELISEQAYVFKDRAGRKLTIRPELTPTLARMIFQKQQQLIKPIRWLEIGNFWRYESPQKGRFREFYQWNVDLLGPSSPLADAEIIALICEFFKEINLTEKEVVIKISDRRLLQNKLDLIGVDKNQILPIIRIIDKKDRLKTGDFEKLLKEVGLSNLQIKDLEKILQDSDFSNESDWLTELFSTLKDLDVASYCQFDPKVVRGLDYYTSTVFEAFDKKGEFRAIAAGGRYDNLVADVGGQPLSGVGFGLGDAITLLLLEKLQKLPKLNPVPTEVLITIFDQAYVRDSLKIANLFRKKLINSELYCEITKLDKQLKYANNMKIPYVVIIGPEEVNNNLITIKNMATKIQKTINVDEAIEILKK